MADHMLIWITRDLLIANFSGKPDLPCYLNWIEGSAWTRHWKELEDGIYLKNKPLEWSLELIECFADSWNWTALSKNEALPWTSELIERFENSWDRVWLEEEDDREDCWKWKGLSRNKALPWTLNLIERYVDRWNWEGLSANEVLPWSLDLIERFEDRWNWQCLSETKSLSLPLLSAEDIVEIMMHHSANSDSRTTLLE